MQQYSQSVTELVPLAPNKQGVPNKEEHGCSQDGGGQVHQDQAGQGPQLSEQGVGEEYKRAANHGQRVQVYATALERALELPLFLHIRGTRSILLSLRSVAIPHVSIRKAVPVPPALAVTASTSSYLSQASCVIVGRPVYSSAGLGYISP